MVHLDKTDVDKGTCDTSHEACDHRNPGPVITRPVKGRNYQLEREPLPFDNNLLRICFRLLNVWEGCGQYSREHLTTPPCHCSEDSWSQIPGRVNSIAAVESKGCSDDKNHQTNHDRCNALVRRVVLFISDSENTSN